MKEETHKKNVARIPGCIHQGKSGKITGGVTGWNSEKLYE